MHASIWLNGGKCRFWRGLMPAALAACLVLLGRLLRIGFGSCILCRPYENECIATDSRCSMQKINKHLRAPAQTKDDCPQPLLQAITSLIVDRAKTGLTTKIMKVKSHIGINGNEMADKLANEARKPGNSTVTYRKNTANHSRTNSGYNTRSRCPQRQAPQRNWNLLGICTPACHRNCMRSTTWALQTKTQSTFSCGKTCNHTEIKRTVTIFAP